MALFLNDSSSKFGFAGGLVLSTAFQLDLQDIASTLILGFVGAVASFVGTVVCRFVLRKVRERLQRRSR